MRLFTASLPLLPFLFACSEGLPISRFDVDSEGWTIVGDAQADSTQPDYDDGIICANDDVAGGVWFFHAPSKFLGDRSAALGTDITFDLKSTRINDPFEDIDVLLEGGGKKIVFDTESDPGEDWTTYTVPLRAAGWRIDAIDGAAATEEDLKTTLGDLITFRVRGEFNTGPDTGCLDNVDFD